MNVYDAAIIGGSYAGLSAALALGRSLRKVVVIDDGQPCNRQTPRSHNLILHDGDHPADMLQKALQQVLAYETVSFINARAEDATFRNGLFRIRAGQDVLLEAKKIILATGLRDQMPSIPGFEACWGISVLHCPYCHGYEVKGKKIGVMANGNMAIEMTKLIRNWSRDLVLFTNGPSALDKADGEKLASLGIPVIEAAISSISHNDGRLNELVMADGSRFAADALFARPAFTQQTGLARQLGCEFTDTGLIKVNEEQKTSCEGVFAAGDNASLYRAVSVAIASGTKAAAFLNKDMIDQEWMCAEPGVNTAC